MAAEEFPIAELRQIRERLKRERITKEDIQKLSNLIMRLESTAKALRAAVVE